MSKHSVSLTLTTQNEKDWATAFSLLTTVALDSAEGFSQVTISSVDLDDFPDDGVEEFFDENTMFKVREALGKGLRDHVDLRDSEDAKTDIIITLQNAGILFREIKKD